MSETTQNTPAEVLYHPEKELPAVASIADIDHFRIITKAGESSKATPAQVRELMGIDYSILTEQIAPGEFALAPDGSRKQVYTRTVKIEYPAGYGTGTIFDGLTLTPAFNNVQGFVSVNGFFYFNIGKPLYRVATLENQAVNPFIFGSSGRNVFALNTGAAIAEPSVAIVQVKYYKF